MGTVPYLAFAGTLSAPRLAQLTPSEWAELAFLALGSTVAVELADQNLPGGSL